MTKLRDILQPVATTLATALGGPFAGLAVETIGKVFGMDKPTTDTITKVLTQGALSGDQIAALKQAEQAFIIRCRELDIDVEKLAVEDRKDARALLASTKAHTPAILSWLVILGNFAMMTYLLKYGKPQGLDDVLLGRMLGTVDMAFGVVLAFWLGTSHSSRSKDETIDKLAG